MKTLMLAIIGAALLIPTFIQAGEYGGRWTDESIREYSLKYIENTKARFDRRAARLSEVIDFPESPEYRKLTDEQQKFYEKFLDDRISERNRDGLFRMMMRDLEAVRVTLEEGEKKAFEVWEKLPKEEKIETAQMIEGKIYGTNVNASNLGVLLDNSPSMRPYVEAVRAEIRKTFPDAHFREAADSGLDRNFSYVEGAKTFMDDAWYYGELPETGEVNPFAPKWHQTRIYESIRPHHRQVGLERNALPALMALISLQKVDSLYWFCDFEDEIERAALKMLSEAVKDNGVKLYVHTSKRRPDKELVEVIEASGGEVIRKRIK